ncbi:LRR receptor-like serine/threonine-protein kinase HSL2 [Platanthera zijinensis]|uniref:LRR receptor-like serine/threonine-protein kinase HSL2 n=1 Tax=Platanthera zijinensis TaxID=2320716 RepID=A0AAP0G3H6_9ASPA
MAPHSPFPLLLLLTVSILYSQSTTETEKQILLNIKNEWGNPTSLSSWNSSGDHCKWPGIKCTGDGGGNVSGIYLPNKNLTLPIPASLCNLHGLSHIDLSFNNIPGTFPSVLYNCSALEFLDISQNLFVGELPSDIDSMPRFLTDLILSANNFTGDIPASISRLPAIKRLHLDYNLFNGIIPLEMGNISTLESLWLAANPFLPGSIPPEFGNLTSLSFLWMTNINLAGGMPETLERLVNLEHLDLAMNSLTGVIPSGIWKLKKLKKLYLYGNNLTGEFNESVGGAEALEEIDLSMNKLTGNIPEAVGQLWNLSILFLYLNQFSGDIPENIGRLPKLTDIRLFNNKLTGILPPELGRYSKLKNLEVDDNQIAGKLPENLCEGKALVSLIVFDNELTGNIPEELGSCNTLLNLQIHNNGFSGEFPAGIWSVANLSVLIARQNSLAGSLPDELPWNLTLLDIRNNKFVGKIPSWAGGLRVFYGDDNNFSGELPSNFSDMPLLQVLSLSSNRIFGEIPSSIGSLEFLNQLNLSGNLLSGQIPESIASMPVLNSLDLSVNYLSGEISPKFGALKLNFLNLSSNTLAGEIPASLQNQAYDKSFLSNPALCTSYSLTKLPTCRRRSINQSKISIKVLIVFLFLGSCLFLAILALSSFIYRERRRWRSTSSSDSSSWNLTSFHAVDICESSLARGLTPGNLIGSGGGGMVYRVSFRRKTVAVKKVWNNRKLDAKLEKEFEAEVKILGSIRHANIVKLLCSVYSASSKLLVYEYVENGSLDSWLHRRQREQSRRLPLSWPTRLQIAVGAARGLCYMHHDCLPAVIHRDVKSSNILLDLEFRAKIADFGLARILWRGGEPESVSTIAGSFGYIAPECATLRKVNEKVDVYSFGVVLLELATGREAGDGGEEDEGNLADWAWRRYKEGEGDVKESVDEEVVGVSPEFTEAAEAVFTLGLICTGREPTSRPTMKEVLQVLTNLEQGGHGDAGDEKSGGGELLVNGRSWKKGRRKKKLAELGEDDEDSEAALCGRDSCSSV